MMKQMKRRIEMLETCRFGSARVAAMQRCIHTMTDEDFADLAQSLADERFDDLPPLFDPRTLTEEESEAAIAVVFAPDTD